MALFLLIVSYCYVNKIVLYCIVLFMILSISVKHFIYQGGGEEHLYLFVDIILIKGLSKHTL